MNIPKPEPGLASVFSSMSCLFSASGIVFGNVVGIFTIFAKSYMFPALGYDYG